MFKITPLLSKESILDRTTQEAIFTQYGLSPREGVFSNPYRNDNNPSAGFYRKNGVLYFGDFTGWCNWDCFAFVQHIHNCSFVEALAIIDRDLRSGKVAKVTINKIIEEKRRAEIEVRVKEYNKKDKEYWEQYGISLETLAKYKVYSCDWVRLNGDVFYIYNKYKPAYAYYFGDGEFKIYMPKSKSRFISNTSALQGYEQLPRTGELLIIQKSLKDVMLMSEFGIPSVAVQAETAILSKDIADELKRRFKKIYVWYDNDDAGNRGAEKLSAYGFECIHSSKEKDATDYYRKYGTEAFIEEYLQFIL